ncbi:MAG: hypothetical protein M3536_07975 [Actinomycetota bacterium]|nr:hypothetical protein [Actinomycetota bacterium]
MTITFLAPDGVETTAQQFRQAQAATHGGGSGRRLGGRSGFRVDTPSSILTATSTTWTLTPCAAMIDPGATTHQGVYGWSSDANATGSVTAADATYARKDIVYIQVNDSSAGDGSGALTAPVLYLAGTPASTPAAPALPARSFLVGTISVPVSGGGSPTVVLNPARYAAAGGILPVANDAERTALTAYEGLRVDQFDVDRTYRHNGTRWGQVGPTELGKSSTGVGGTLAETPAFSDILIVTATTLGGEVCIDYNVALTNANSGAHRDAAVRVTCDGAEIDGWSFAAPYVAGIEAPVFPSLQVFHTPTAGAHTWKVQGNASISGAVRVLRGSVTVTEKP